jgi:hypothetical protein
MPRRTQQQHKLLQQIAINMGVPVAKQQGNNDLNIIGTHGLAGQTPPTPSQPFTVNVTLVPTIVYVGGNGGGGSGGEVNGSGGSISLSTTWSSNISTRLPTIPSFHNLGARGATGNSTSHHHRYILTSVPMRSTQRTLLVPSQFLWRILKKWR